MATSGEIAQMMAAQSGQFMQQNAFANNIGIANPAMSLGAYGTPGLMSGFQPMAPGMPGHRAPGAWSYAPGVMGSGYGGGTAFAGSMMSGLGGMANLGMAGIGLAAGFGKLPGLNWLDPFNGFMGPFRAMGGFQGGMGAFGAGLMGAMPALGVGMYASHAVGSMVHGAQQQQMIAGQMGSFQHFNAASRTGAGFTRDDAKAVGDSIRHLAHIPEMLTSVEELTKLLPALRKAGSFQGVKDITEFQDRFKESIKTIKTMSKMLGTTMEEASEFFAHSRGVGFLGKQAQLQNTLNAQYTSGLTGMSLGQVMGSQQQGAALWRSQGMSGRIGAQAVTNWAQQLGYAQQSGKIGDGVLEDITGMQGPEAVAAAAQRFSQTAFQMTQNTAAGRLTTFGLMKFDENGKALGVDEEALAKFKNGELSYHDLKRRAGRLTDTQKVSAMARLRDVGGIVASVAGADGIGRVLQDALSERFGGDTVKGREALNLMLQRNGGLSAMESDVIMSQIGDGTNDQDMQTMGKIRMQRSMEKEKYSPAAMWKRFKTKAHKGLGFAGLEQMGADMQNEFAKAYEEFWDDIFDRNVVQVSKEGADAFKRAMGGDSKNLKRIFAEAHGVDLNAAFDRRSTSQMTGGRVARMLIGGGVGLVAGVASGFNPLVGAGAAAATMAAINPAALDRHFNGGLSEEELAIESARGRAWNRYGGVDGWSADQTSRARQGLISSLMGRSFKNGEGDQVSFAALSPEERARAAMSGGLNGALDRMTGLLTGGKEDAYGGARTAARQLMEAYAGGGDFSFRGSNQMGARALAKKYGITDRASYEKFIAQDEYLSLSHQSAEQARRDDAAGGIRRRGGVEEWFAGGIAKISGGIVDDWTQTGGATSREIMGYEAIGQLKSESSKAFGKLGIDAGEQQALGKSRTAQNLLTAIAKGDKEVEEALVTGDISKLKEKFPGVSPADLALAKSVHSKTGGDKGKLAKLAAAVGQQRSASSAEDRITLQGLAKDAYGRFADHLSKSDLSGAGRGHAEKLAAALQTIGTTTDQGEFFSALDAAKGAVGGLVESGAGLKGKDLEKYIAALGPEMGKRVREGIHSGRGLAKKGKVTREDIAKQLNLGKDDEVVKNIAASVNLGEGRDLNEAEAMKLQGQITAVKTAGGIAPDGATKSPHDKDKEIVQALKGIQDASKLQVTLLATIAGVSTEKLGKLQGVYKQQSTTKVDGTVDFQGTGPWPWS